MPTAFRGRWISRLGRPFGLDFAEELRLEEYVRAKFGVCKCRASPGGERAYGGQTPRDHTGFAWFMQTLLTGWTG